MQSVRPHLLFPDARHAYQNGRAAQRVARSNGRAKRLTFMRGMSRDRVAVLLANNANARKHGHVVAIRLPCSNRPTRATA